MGSSTRAGAWDNPPAPQSSPAAQGLHAALYPPPARESRLSPARCRAPIHPECVLSPVLLISIRAIRVSAPLDDTFFIPAHSTSKNRCRNKAFCQAIFLYTVPYPFSRRIRFARLRRLVELNDTSNSPTTGAGRPSVRAHRKPICSERVLRPFFLSCNRIISVSPVLDDTFFIRAGQTEKPKLEVMDFDQP